MLCEGTWRPVLDGDNVRRAEHSVEVARPATRPRLLTTPPERYLGHRCTDDEEQHGGLDVSAVGDLEAPIGLGQEEVEPQTARQSNDETGQSHAGGGYGDDDKHKHEGDRGGGHAIPERSEPGAEHQGHDRCDREQRRAVRVEDWLNSHVDIKPPAPADPRSSRAQLARWSSARCAQVSRRPSRSRDRLATGLDGLNRREPRGPPRANAGRSTANEVVEAKRTLDAGGLTKNARVLGGDLGSAPRAATAATSAVVKRQACLEVGCRCVFRQRRAGDQLAGAWGEWAARSPAQATLTRRRGLPATDRGRG